MSASNIDPELPEDELEFQECSRCRRKPGMPVLCKWCLHNRRAIFKLKQMLEEAKKAKEYEVSTARICVVCNVANYLRGGRFLLKAVPAAATCPKCGSPTWSDIQDAKDHLNEILKIIDEYKGVFPSPIQCSPPTEQPGSSSRNPPQGGSSTAPPIQCSPPAEQPGPSFEPKTMPLPVKSPFSGDKYKRWIYPVKSTPGEKIVVDVYSVIKAFEVTSAGLQQCLKKILCPGQRGKADRLKDLREAMDALQRAIEQEEEEVQAGKIAAHKSMERWCNALGINPEELKEKPIQDIGGEHS